MEYIKYQISQKFSNLKVIDFLKYHRLAKNKINNYKFKETIKINSDFKSLDSILKADDILELLVDEKIDFLFDNKPIKIVYEDDYLLIIDKEPFLNVHPDDKNKNGTLVNRVANYFSEKGLNRQVRYIHRIDIETTGLIMFGKDFLTASHYNYLFSKHLVTREYIAIASGIIKNEKDTINAPIGEDRHHKIRRRVSKTGAEAITNYEIIEKIKNYSLVKLTLKTGRTHQIRVHMKYIGHPLAGDELYGGRLTDIKRVALHSYSLLLQKPYQEELLQLTCPIPLDMQKVIEKHRQKGGTK